MNIQYTKENNYMRISNKGIALILLTTSTVLLSACTTRTSATVEAVNTESMTAQEDLSGQNTENTTGASGDQNTESTTGLPNGQAPDGTTGLPSGQAPDGATGFPGGTDNSNNTRGSDSTNGTGDMGGTGNL